MTERKPDAFGDFAQCPLPRLLFYLYRKQVTGFLATTRGGAKVVIYLRKGMPIRAHTATDAAWVARILQEMGCLDERGSAELVAAAATAAQGEMGPSDFDHLLAERQVAPPAKIEQALRQHLFRVLMNVFEERQAPFQVFSEEHAFGAAPEEAARLPIHPRLVIYHGVGRLYDMVRIRTEMGDALGQAFTLNRDQTASLERYGLSEADRATAAQLDQPRTLDELIARTGRSELELGRLLYVLSLTGLLEATTPTASRLVATPVSVAPGTPGALTPRSRPGSYRLSGKALPRAETVGIPGAEAKREARPTPSAPAPKPRATPHTDPPLSEFVSEPSIRSQKTRMTTLPPGVRLRSQPPSSMRSVAAISSLPPPILGTPVPHTSADDRGATTMLKEPMLSEREVAALNVEALTFYRQIEQRVKFFDQQDHFDVLGISRLSGEADITASFHTLYAIFHPDELAKHGLTKVAGHAERIRARLLKARQIVSDERKRDDYLKRLDGPAHGNHARLEAIYMGEYEFGQGEAALRRQQIDAAIAHFRCAVDLSPDVAEHPAFLAWALFQDPLAREASMQEIKHCLSRAIKLNRESPYAYYFLGEVFAADNDLERATAYFRRAVELKGDYLEAERSLRLAVMRKDKGGKGRKK